MKKCLRHAVFLLCALSLSGCLVPQAQLRLEEDMEVLKRRLADVERHSIALRQDQAEESGRRIQMLGQQQADLKAELDSLRVEVQSLLGRFEDTGNQDKQLRDDLNLFSEDLGLKMTAMEDRVATLEEQLKAVEQVKAQPAAGQVSAEELYQQGVDQVLKVGNFSEAQRLLKDFLQRYPTHPLSVNAMYWIGEAYYGQKEYENAILQFQDVIQKYPQHTKAPAALLKQGLSFHALGDLANARAILGKVVENYPDSEEATKAKQRLESWQ